MTSDDVRLFFEQFQDFLAPRLDMYEQAIYLYAFRHSRFVGLAEVTIGFKSARKRLALGTGKMGTPPSEGVIYEKLRSLQKKGCIQLVSSERAGTRIRVHLPSEIPGLVTAPIADDAESLEEMDFFSIPANRAAIVARE